jgi:hypothetical protein
MQARREFLSPGEFRKIKADTPVPLLQQEFYSRLRKAGDTE